MTIKDINGIYGEYNHPKEKQDDEQISLEEYTNDMPELRRNEDNQRQKEQISEPRKSMTKNQNEDKNS